MAPRRLPLPLPLPLLLPAPLEQWRQHVRHRLQQNRQVQAQQHLRLQRPVRHQLPHQLRLLHFGHRLRNVAYGNAPDEVHGLGLCRGDILDNVTCFECLSTASMVAQALCPYDKDAALFYDGYIMRFSDQDFLFFKDNEPVVGLNTTETVKPAAAASSFDALVDLINKTAEHAAASGVPPTGKKVATGEAVFDAGGHQTAVYTLVQCTPDLTASECSGCLDQVKYILADRVLGALGGRVAGVRCNGRLEVYPFYIGKAMVRVEGPEAPAPAPLPLRPLPPLVPLMPPVSSGSQKGK
jgi:hypothetical protein